MARHAHAVLILIALTGLATFSVMDGFMKEASILVGAYAAMALRSVAGTALMLPVWLGRRGRWPAASTIRLHALRAVVAGVMAVLFFYGVVRTPLAEGIALSFIAPLIALYLAAIWLGEPVGRRAVGGSLLALMGVGVIVAGKLGGHYSAEGVKGLCAILVSAVLYAWNLVLQRRQALLAGPEEVAFFQNAVTALVLLPGLLWVAPAPTPAALGWIVTSAALSAASLMLMTWAYARAETRVLVPLEYTAFIWAAIVGWLMFGEALTLRTLAGVALIVAGCLIAVRAGKANAASAGKVPEPAA